MNYNKHTRKNVPAAILEKWIKQILEDYDADDLLEFLVEQTESKTQKGYLFDKMKELLQMEANVKMFTPTTMEEEMKYEAFILDVKPLYNDRQEYLF